MRLIFVIAAMLLTLAGAHAVQPDEVLNDPVLEGRARDISSGLRCLVCQNQSIDDSDAALARDLRLLVRERLRAGETDAQVRDFVVRRYGEFVLLRPTIKGSTLLLWLTPVLLLALGCVGVYAAIRRHAPSADLDAEEARALDGLLRRDNDPEKNVEIQSDRHQSPTQPRHSSQI